MNTEVSIVRCEDYDVKRVKQALVDALLPLGGLDWVTPGMKIAVKANLLMPAKPEKAATLHPSVAVALCELLKERQAEVVVGDSPGGPFSAAYLNAVYQASGMTAVLKTGASLNENFSFSEVSFPQAVSAKQFHITDYLAEADAVIDLCKLKTHGLMAFTGACKNLFGAVPGTRKSEYHYRYQTHEAFANMLVDLCEWIKPRLSIADGIIAMEGNGPSGGTPRHMGAILASKNPHALDLAAAHLMNLGISEVPTLRAAFERGLIPDSAEKLGVFHELSPFVIPDFKLIPKQGIQSWGLKGKAFSAILGKLLASRPQVETTGCVGCGVCKNACPANAIVIEKRIARIDREKCVKCFCCQEFCPEGAIRVHRPPVARILGGSEKTKRV